MSTAASGSSRCEASRVVKHILPSPTRGGPPRRKPPQMQSVGGPPRRAPPRVNGALVAAPAGRVASPKAVLIAKDDESDLELLSLSSDDDETKAPRAIVLGNQLLKAQGAVVDKSDDLWYDNDEEPQTWGGVDQAELARRVREIRETRKAPASYGAATRLRKSTNFLDVVPKADDLVDPLGLGLIDIRSLTLIPTDKMENLLPRTDKWSDIGRGLLEVKKDDMTTATRNTCGEDPTHPELSCMKDFNTREKVDFHSENFDVRFFLVHIHPNTSAHDLEVAGDALKGNLQSHKENLMKLVKENFDCFISCKNTIDDIHSKLEQIECAKEGTGTEHLHNAIAEVVVVAKRAFAPLLELQSQAERTRSVQRMLKRFRTLFNLPMVIRSDIRKGEFGLAIREYEKAKSLALYSHVGIFGRVLKEVKIIIQELAEMLYKRMEDPHLELSQLKNTFRLLLKLEPNSDLLWHYLTIQDRRIRGLLEGCTLEHEARMKDLVGRVRQRAQSDARWKQLQRERNKGSDVDFNLLLGSKNSEQGRNSIEDSTDREPNALLSLLIRRLTAIIVTHLPSFWGLAISVFNGSFYKVTVGSLEMRKLGSVLNSESGSYTFGNVPKPIFISHSLDEVITMIHFIISLYESKVKTAFLALSGANVLCPYMLQAVAEISKACVTLEGKRCVPARAFEMLVVLRTEVARVYVQRLCAFMNMATADLVNEEDWILIGPIERGGSSFTISSTPVRFQDMLESTMERLTELLDRLKQETPQHEDMVYQLQQMQDNVQHTFFMCFRTLAENMERLEYELFRTLPDENAETEIDQEQLGPGRFATFIARNEVSDHHQRLLVLLSNAGFCNTLLLPELSRKYQQIWFNVGKDEQKEIRSGDSQVTAEEVSVSFSSLEIKILNRYEYVKGTSVGKAAADFLLNDGTHWSTSPPVKGIRDAVVELLNPLVSVHAEVCAMAAIFVDKVIKHLSVELMDALLKVFIVNKRKVLKSLDVQGYCQLMLEIEYIEAVLGGYLTTPARDVALQCRSLLLDEVLETVGDISDLGSKRSTSSDDGDDMGFVSMSQEEIQVLAENVIADYLPNELKRTRINVSCFMDVPQDSNLQERGPRFTQQPTLSRGVVPGVLRSRYCTKNSTSNMTDSEWEKLVSAFPPIPES
ncbi:exocyst complex component SEC5B isoform X5 [Physcomitrium patens]|nr:exocyst complex component SEC5B-like isoform X3 [Physcomitrium patens]|eukprot:XP_024363496.1 exocyst complex component SEC5B-like isoform X3 [Physcomitrella patens]